VTSAVAIYAAVVATMALAWEIRKWVTEHSESVVLTVQPQHYGPQDRSMQEERGAAVKPMNVGWVEANVDDVECLWKADDSAVYFLLRPSPASPDGSASVAVPRRSSRTIWFPIPDESTWEALFKGCGASHAQAMLPAGRPVAATWRVEPRSGSHPTA
jgi:hypothetical protein